MNPPNKINELGWRLLPFLLTGLVIFWMIRCNSGDLAFYFFAVPFLTIICFGFSVLMTNAIRIVIKTKYYDLSQEEIDSDIEIEKLRIGITKWGIIAIIAAITMLLSIVIVVISRSIISGNDAGQNLIRGCQPEVLSCGFLYNLLFVIDIIIVVLGFAPLVAMAIGAIILFVYLIRLNSEKDEPVQFYKRAGIFTICLFIIPIFLCLLISSIFEGVVRKNIIDTIEIFSSDASVLINGMEVENDTQIIKELAKTTPMLGHHSHSSDDRILIEVKDSKQGVVLVLGRDSSVKNEYWVFYPGYNSTYSNEIGRITTDIFDKY